MVDVVGLGTDTARQTADPDEALLRTLSKALRVRGIARLHGRVRDAADQEGELIAAGLVRPTTAFGPEGSGFAVDRMALFTLIEDLRSLASDASNHIDPKSTTTVPGVPAGTWLNGPKLILVNGICEGSTYPLDIEPGHRSWVIGRGGDVDVPLLYDPYVSRHGAEVWQDGKTFFIEDLAPGKNGTYLNWRRLDKREAASLQDGDIVGLGRSLLVFRST